MAGYDQSYLASLAQRALANKQYGADMSPRNAFGNAIGEDPRFPQASMVVLPSGEGKYLLPDGTEVPYPGVSQAAEDARLANAKAAAAAAAAAAASRIRPPDTDIAGKITALTTMRTPDARPTLAGIGPEVLTQDATGTLGAAGAALRALRKPAYDYSKALFGR